jgi:hypothetical protein
MSPNGKSTPARIAIRAGVLYIAMFICSQPLD